MICHRCNTERGDEFYPKDRTCKECRRALVNANRERKADYYREYDKRRFQSDPRVRERHKRYQATDAGKKSIADSTARFIAKNPEKRAAHVKLGNAVRDGKISKPKACPSCGREVRIHGHHADYSKPLDVIWRCALCHVREFHK